MSEINLQVETIVVETKVEKTKWSIVYEEPEFCMSFSVYKWYLVKTKNLNLVRRLKAMCNYE